MKSTVAFSSIFNGMLQPADHLENFRRQLRKIDFKHDVNFRGLLEGQSTAYVQFYRLLLCDHDPCVTKLLVDRGYDILGSSDYRFMEVLYRILLNMFDMRPLLTLTQFYHSGFVSRKLEMATMITSSFHEMRRWSSMKRISSLPIRLQRQQILQHQMSPSLSLRASSSSLMQSLRTSKSAKSSMTQKKPKVMSNSPETSKPKSRTLFSRTTDEENELLPPSQLKPVVSEITELFNGWTHKTGNDNNNNNRNNLSRSLNRGRSSSLVEQQNQCSTFCASIPNVAQLNPTHQGSRNSPTKKSKPSYLPNTYSRPSSVISFGHSSLRGAKLPPANQRSPSLSRNSSFNINYSTVHSDCSSTRQPPSQMSTVVDKLSDNAIQDILSSLELLSGKVDSMLTRMNRLESRLSLRESGIAMEDSHSQHQGSTDNASSFRRSTNQEFPSDEKVGNNERSDFSVQSSFRRSANQALLPGEKIGHVEPSEISVHSNLVDQPLPRSSTELNLPSPKSGLPLSAIAASRTTEAQIASSTLASYKRPADYRTMWSTQYSTSPRRGSSFDFTRMKQTLPTMKIDSRGCGQDRRYDSSVSLCSDPAPSFTAALQTNTLCPSQSTHPDMEENLPISTKTTPDKSSWPTTSLRSSPSPPPPSPYRSSHCGWRSVQPKQRLSHAVGSSANNNNEITEPVAQLPQPFRDQVDRIASMLAETQGLLSASQAGVAVNGTA